MTEHDQVGQVRAGKHQRTGVGEEQTAVDQGRLALTSSAGGVDQDGGEEGDRGVEVQDGGDGHDENHGAHIEDHAVASAASQSQARRREQPVFIGDEADEEQAADEDERRPVLGRSFFGMAGRQCACDDRSGDPEREQRSPEASGVLRDLGESVSTHGR